MNTPSTFVVAALSAAALASSAHGSISLTTFGNAINLNFSTPPVVTDISTGIIGDHASDYDTIAELNAGVQSASIDDITTALTPVTNFTSASDVAKFHSTDGSIYSLPNSSGNSASGATLILATLQNDSGNNVSMLRIAYDYSRVGGNVAEDIPGLRAYYSLTGAANSWQLIAPLSVDTTASPSSPNAMSTDVVLSSVWTSGSKLYVLWADDNIQNNDNGYKIDNLSFNAEPNQVSIPEPSVALLGGIGALALLSRRRN